MRSENKLFKSGDVILFKKNYGWGTMMFLIILIGIFLNMAVVTLFGVPNDYLIAIMDLILIIVLGLIWQKFFREKFFPNAAFGMRYDDIVLFDEYLIGRLLTRIGKEEEKIQFNDIQHIVQERNNEIIITFKKDFKSGIWVQMDKNRSQDYIIASNLTKNQKRELVNYLNERIKKSEF